LNQRIYESNENLPANATVEDVLELCVKHRLPRLTAELEKAKPFHRAILAGDFNEPSHLDLQNLQVPVSQEFEKYGFLDSFRISNPDIGYTWPTGGLYTGEPSQRIDMIYTKNIEVLESVVYEEDPWISDHKMVITDMKF
jgi:endonuclease/exonuclease/phosphatase family metal-dependent hydrolase